MKIKNLQDIQNIKKEYRVIDSTHFPNQEKEEMIGGIFECANVDYKNSWIVLYNQDKSYPVWFNISDVQEVTPLEYNDHRIGIGDWVKYNGQWYEVYGYHWYADRFYLKTAQVKDDTPDYGHCWIISSTQISDTKPLYQKEDATTQAIELLKKKGYKIIKE